MQASCSPDFPPIFWFPTFFLEREIHCKQGAMWSSRAGATKNWLIQQRQVSRSCSFRCNYQRTTGHLPKHRGWILQTIRQILCLVFWFLFRFLFRFLVPICSAVFSAEKLQLKIRTKIREGLFHSKYGPQSTGWLTHECRFWCGSDIHINDYLH